MVLNDSYYNDLGPGKYVPCFFWTWNFPAKDYICGPSFDVVSIEESVEEEID